MMLLSQVSFKRTGLIEASMGFWASQGDLSRQRCLWGVFMNGVQTSGLGAVWDLPWSGSQVHMRSCHTAVVHTNHAYDSFTTLVSPAHFMSTILDGWRDTLSIESESDALWDCPCLEPPLQRCKTQLCCTNASISCV